MFGGNINIYEVANNGNWYNLGFIFGLIIWIDFWLNMVKWSKWLRYKLK
jgi:hypothetical protein